MPIKKLRGQSQVSESNDLEIIGVRAKIIEWGGYSDPIYCYEINNISVRQKRTELEAMAMAKYRSDGFAFDRTGHTMTATTSTPEFGSGDGDDLDASLA